MGASAWRRAVASALPTGGGYLLGAEELPPGRSDCSGGASNAATALGFNDGRRWTVASLLAAIGGVEKLRAGLPGPDDAGAVGFWNGSAHTMTWNGAGWWGYHGSTGSPASHEPATYWSDAYQGWAPFPVPAGSESKRRAVLQVATNAATRAALVKRVPNAAGLAGAWEAGDGLV